VGASLGAGVTPLSLKVTEILGFEKRGLSLERVVRFRLFLDGSAPKFRQSTVLMSANADEKGFLVWAQDPLVGI
jgi:hypothetical protein